MLNPEPDPSDGLSTLQSPAPDVDLWWCDLDQRAANMAPCVEWLSASERERANRFGTARLRDRYIAGRTALRLLLSRLLDVAPGTVLLRRGPRGRPELAEARVLDFNVSHTDGVGLIGIARDARDTLRIGVDVERADRVVGADRLARKFLTANERESRLTLPVNERTASFLRHWTCKEAMSKATGDGLAAPLGAIDVALGDPPRLVDGPPPYLPEQWRLYTARAPVGYLATLAVWNPRERP